MKQATKEEIAGYFENGYAVFPGILEERELGLLSDLCDKIMAGPTDDDNGGKGPEIGRGTDRQFLAGRHVDYPELEAFLLSDEMKRFTAPFLDETPHLFNEQFVVKGPRTGAAFAWHQDGAYVGFDHPTYLSVWISIDETTIENGPVYLLPKKLSEDTTLVPHHWDEGGKELVGFEDADAGMPAIVPAGSVVIFSSATLHRSSPNTSDKARRAYLAQYSRAPIISPETGAPKRFAKAL